MGILAWIVLGLIAGLIAKILMPGNDPGGLIVTTLLGIAGAIVGGYLAVALGIGQGVNALDIGSIITAVLGAIIVLVGLRVLRRA